MVTPFLRILDPRRSVQRPAASVLPTSPPLAPSSYASPHLYIRPTFPIPESKSKREIQKYKSSPYKLFSAVSVGSYCSLQVCLCPLTHILLLLFLENSFFVLHRTSLQHSWQTCSYFSKHGVDLLKSLLTSIASSPLINSTFTPIPLTPLLSLRS